MNKNGKKVFTSLAVLAGLASGAGALNAFVNRTVKTMLYRHHKEDDKPSILETKYNAKNIHIKSFFAYFVLRRYKMLPCYCPARFTGRQ